MNRRERRKVLATIDMTPLMDLTFMLLIIFVITVPSMYYKSDVSLTPPESNTNDRMEVDERSLFVELDRNGGIWLGQGTARRSRSLGSARELTSVLSDMKHDNPDMVVYLVGDRERRYKEVIEVANAVQKSGIGTLSLVFDPEGQDGGGE